MEIVSGGVEKEANQALINMGAILKSVGCDYKNVVKTTVLLSDIKDFVPVNEIYKKFFTSHELFKFLCLRSKSLNFAFCFFLYFLLSHHK